MLYQYRPVMEKRVAKYTLSEKKKNVTVVANQSHRLIVALKLAITKLKRS